MEKLSSVPVSEIRSRLPIKSIFQCREVCRIWRNLFKKPNGGMLFLNLPEYMTADVKLYNIEVPSDVEQPQNLNKKVIQISSSTDGIIHYRRLIGSCNGLVCYSAFDLQFGDAFFISNPITGERIAITEMGQNFTTVGFGYCDSTNEYKVFRTIYDEGDHRVQVYTLGDGIGWRDKPDITLFQGAGIFADGALHWLNDIRPKCDIVAFDLTDETFRSLPPPPCHIPSESYRDIDLGSLEGNLYMCIPYTKKGENMMDIWIFKKKNMNNCRRSTRLKLKRRDFKSYIWIKVFSRKWDSSLSQNCQLLSLTETAIILWQKGVISCYDRKTRPFHKLWCAEAASGRIQAIPHIHSLVSLEDLGEELVDSNIE